MMYNAISRLKDVRAVLAYPMRVNGAYLFEALALGAIGMSILTLGLLAIDDRTLAGEPVWLKPFKFAVSFAVLFATGLLRRPLCDPRFRSGTTVRDLALQPSDRRDRRRVRGSLTPRDLLPRGTGRPAGGVPLQGEHALPRGDVRADAAWGDRSLRDDPGLGIVVWWDREARLGPGQRLGLGLGFLLTTVLTSLVAGELADNGGHNVGVPGDAQARLPLLGWSMEVGDLRAPHFFALHAMQVLPLLGHLVDRHCIPSRSLWMVAVLYAIFTTLVFLQALRGVPLIGA